MSNHVDDVTEIEFSWQHDCPFNQLTREHTELTLDWDIPAVGVDASTVIGVFSVDGLDETLTAEELVTELESFSSVLRVERSTNNVFEAELRRDMITMSPELLAECFDVQIHEYEGIEDWRVVTPSKRVKNYLFYTLDEITDADFTLRRKTSIKVDTKLTGAELPTEAVTDKQYEAIVTAYEKGYFEYPRRSTAEEVANELDITASSYISRLRRGQRRLIEELLDQESDIGE